MISFHFILKNCGKKFSQSRICGQAGKVKSTAEKGTILPRYFSEIRRQMLDHGGAFGAIKEGQDNEQ